MTAHGSPGFHDTQKFLELNGVYPVEGVDKINVHLDATGMCVRFTFTRGEIQHVVNINQLTFAAARSGDWLTILVQHCRRLFTLECDCRRLRRSSFEWYARAARRELVEERERVNRLLCTREWVKRLAV